MLSPSPSLLILIMNDLGTKVGKTLCSRFVLDLVWNRKGTMYHKIGILLEQSVNRNMHGTDGEQGGNVRGTILDFSFHLCSGLTSSWSTHLYLLPVLTVSPLGDGGVGVLPVLEVGPLGTHSASDVR